APAPCRDSGPRSPTGPTRQQSGSEEDASVNPRFGCDLFQVDPAFRLPGQRFEVNGPIGQFNIVAFDPGKRVLAPVGIIPLGVVLMRMGTAAFLARLGC